MVALFSALCVALGLAKMVLALDIAAAWIYVRAPAIFRIIVVPPLLLAAFCIIDIGWIMVYGDHGGIFDFDVLTLSVTYVAAMTVVSWAKAAWGVYQRYWCEDDSTEKC